MVTAVFVVSGNLGHEIAQLSIGKSVVDPDGKVDIIIGCANADRLETLVGGGCIGVEGFVRRDTEICNPSVIIVIMYDIVFHRFDILEGYRSQLVFLAAVLVIVRYIEIAAISPSGSPAIFAEPRARLRRLGNQIIIPADDGDGMIEFIRVIGGLIMNVILHVRIVRQKGGSDGAVVHYFLLDSIDISQIAFGYVKFNIADIIIVVVVASIIGGRAE